MTTRIKAFLYGVNNIAMVNPYNLWFTGGDYDIDKVYSMGYTVKNGKVVGWSRYFNYSDERYLRLSMLLPHPNGETITYDENGIKLDFNDINNIREFNNAYISKNQSNIDAIYKNFVHTMRKIQSNNIAVVDLAGNITDIPNDIKQFLDDYFTEDINKSLEEAGLFNTYIHELNSSARDIANQAHHQRAMDMGVVKDAGKASAKGEASKEVTPMNPANIAEFKETNMIGKQVIGIVATGLKVYSALCTYYMNKLNKNDFNNMLFNNDVMLRIQNETGEVVDKDIVWNAIGTINFERLYGNLEKLSNKLGEEGIDKDTFIQNMMLMDTYNESTSLVVSSLLSSATDFKLTY